MSLEQHWATVLKKTQQKSMRQSVPLEARKEHLKEELKHFKNELKKMIEEKNNQQIEKLLITLFELRAEQALIKMREFKDQYGFADENIIKKETRAYFQDCRRLLKAVKKTS